MINTKEILKKHWGFSSFKNPQEEIINTILNNKDCLALLPTGGGKSVCFQIPALAKKGVCLVISPLIALIQDQIKQLKQKNIKAVTIPPKSSEDEIIRIFDAIKFSEIKFLYLSPERLQSRLIQQKLKEISLNILAVDEAHCISEWGHDFRPSYRNIKKVKQLFPNITTIALTATANKKVIKDMISSLDLLKPKVIKKTLFKENLAYHVLEVENKFAKLLQIFSKFKKPSIVYVNKRIETHEVAKFLNSNNYKTSFYHAGLTSKEKDIAFKDWMSEKTPIIVATNAFGMGIDKSNTGLVVHYSLPFGIENYVQEAGRAGRDGKKAFAILMKNQSDILLQKERFAKNLPSIFDIKTILKSLYQHFQITLGELRDENFSFNMLEFSEKYNFYPPLVESILAILKNHMIIDIDKNYTSRSTVIFTINSKQLLQQISKAKEIYNFTTTLLRTYSGLFDNETTINEFSIAKKAGITSKKAIFFLSQLHNNGSIIYNKSNSTTKLKFLVPREDDLTINRISKEIKQFLYQKEKKANDFINFINNNKVCRSIQLLNYFDEENYKKCGICDVCKKSENSLSEKKVQLLIKKNGALTSFEISMLLDADEKEILIHLRSLIAKNLVTVTAQNKYILK